MENARESRLVSGALGIPTRRSSSLDGRHRLHLPAERIAAGVELAQAALDPAGGADARLGHDDRHRSKQHAVRFKSTAIP